MAGSLNVNLVFSTTVVAFGLSFLYGYNIGVLNQPKQLIVDFFNETYRQRYGEEVSQESLTMLWSLTTALFIPGGIIGSLLGGWLADAIGRKRTTLVSQVFTLLGAICSSACVAASAPELLMLGRVLVGINSGLVNCVAPMVLSETCPFKYRGAFGTVHQLSTTIGIFLSSVFGMPNLLGTAELWPYLILLQAIPAVISLAITPFMPDTPRYLMIVKHQERAAEKAMQFYRRSPNVASEMEEMSAEGKKAKPMSADRDGGGAAAVAEAETEKKVDDEEKSRPTSVKQLFMDRQLRQPLFIACALVTIQQFSGINAVFFYSQSIFENAKVQAEYIPFAVMAANGVNVVMTLIAVPLIRGRKEASAADTDGCHDSRSRRYDHLSHTAANLSERTRHRVRQCRLRHRLRHLFCRRARSNSHVHRVGAVQTRTATESDGCSRHYAVDGGFRHCYWLRTATGGAEAVHVHRIHRLSVAVFTVHLLHRSGDEEQDVRADCQSVRVVETKQS